MRALIALALLLSGCAAQKSILVSAGAGKGITEAAGTPFERVGEVGAAIDLGQDFFVRADAIGYLSGGYGQSSFYFGPVFGIRAQSALGPELHFAIGPGYLTNPDYEILGGPFQFNLEGGLSLVSKDGNTSLGLVWNHLSSASIYPINQGRDFIMLQWGILNL